MDVVQEEEQKLTGKVLNGLAQITNIQTFGITDINSPKFAKRGGVVAFFLKGKISSGIANTLAFQGGIGARWGCHCTHIFVKYILGIGPKLEQFQRVIVTLFPKLQLPGVVRVSFGIGNSEEEIDTFIRVLANIARKPEKSGNSQTKSPKNGTPVLTRPEVQKQMKEFVKVAAERVYSVI
jgi:selenocysteine lyase/cysteine desulfurase